MYHRENNHMTIKIRGFGVRFPGLKPRLKFTRYITLGNFIITSVPQVSLL